MQRRLTNGFVAVLLALCMVCTYSLIPGEGAVYAASKKTAPKSVTLKYKSTTLNGGSYALKKGKTIQLKATVLPKKAAKTAKIVWKSSNKKVVSVTSKGKIKALKAGKATITVSVKGTKKKAKVTVYVGTPVKNVKVGDTAITLKQGDTYTVKAKLNPKKTKIKGVKYSTNNKNVASVSSNGVISAIAPGSAVITVKPKDLAGKATKWRCQEKCSL